MSDHHHPHRRDQATEIAELLGKNLERILGRTLLGEPTQEQRRRLNSSRILVTGAGGSIGRALSEWLHQVRPQNLALLDNHEDSLFKLKQHLGLSGSTENAQFIMADVRDRHRMELVLGQVRPDVIFHLAAYKHVPLAEEWPEEFVQVNVVATWQLAQIAANAGVRKLVYASTDKAVNPPSVYGATKRVAELLLQGLALGASATQFTVVRLVNVIGARGGVVETFARDILASRPVRITDPRMTRYWITFPEALFLLISAACRDSTGDVLLPNAGEAVSVPDIARRILSVLRGFEAELDVEWTGIRPGERLNEELVYPHERLRTSSLPGILEVVRDQETAGSSLGELAEEVTTLRRLAEEGRGDELREQLFRIVRTHR